MKSATILGWALNFLGNLVLATFGVVILTFTVGYWMAATLDPMARFIDYLFVAPSFAIPFGIGLLLGSQFGWRLSRWTVGLICVPPLAFLFYGFHASHQSGLPWSGVWARFFGTTCVGPECSLQFGAQVLATVPLVAALGYVGGAEFGRRTRGKTHIPNVRPQASWRRGTYVGMVFLAILLFSEVQRFAHQGISIEFEWNATSGFQSASIKRPPASRLVRTIIAPLNHSTISQTLPRIVSELKGSRLRMLRGCIEPRTLWVLPVVLGLDHLSSGSCVVTYRE